MRKRDTFFRRYGWAEFSGLVIMNAMRLVWPKWNEYIKAKKLLFNSFNNTKTTDAKSMLAAAAVMAIAADAQKGKVA